MIFLTSGYWQDGLKAVVYLIPLIYLIVQRKRLNLKYFWLFCIGLSLLFLGNLLDFMDEFESLRRTFDSELLRLLQDFFEDIIGSMFGFILFVVALYKEYKFIKGRR